MMENELTSRSDSSVYNNATEAAQLFQEKYNAAHNLDYILKAIKDWRAKDIADYPKAEGKPCFVIGSGGSLDDAMPKLHAWKGGIACSTSHARALVKHGAPPTHIIALDPFCQFSEIAGPDWSKYDTILVATPTIWPDLIKNWPGKIALYRQNHGRHDTFHATDLRFMYSERSGFREGRFDHHIRTEITLFASSPPFQMFAMSVLGYGPIFLSGVDFSFTCGKDRFTDWSLDGDTWVAKENPYVKADTDIMMVNGCPTAPVHSFYKKNFITAWRLSMQDVWDTGPGCLIELPHADLDRVIRKQGYGIHGISAKEKIERAETYLAMVGSFVIETSRGFQFIESKDPMKELPQYIQAINRTYECPECKVQLRADTDDPQVGEECPQCKKGKLERGIFSDQDKNMKRIEKRLKGAEKMQKDYQKKIDRAMMSGKPR